jgi:hypothetical protein
MKITHTSITFPQHNILSQQVPCYRLEYQGFITTIEHFQYHVKHCAFLYSHLHQTAVVIMSTLSE